MKNKTKNSNRIRDMLCIIAIRYGSAAFRSEVCVAQSIDEIAALNRECSASDRNEGGIAKVGGEKRGFDGGTHKDHAE